MSKEYFYVVKWSESAGWQIDPDTESANFPEGTVYDNEAGEWQLAYLGDGEYNGREQELTEDLTHILNVQNTIKGESKWECTECSSNHTMPRDFGCDDCDLGGAMKGREYICGDHLTAIRECGCKL